MSPHGFGILKGCGHKILSTNKRYDLFQECKEMPSIKFQLEALGGTHFNMILNAQGGAWHFHPNRVMSRCTCPNCCCVTGRSGCLQAQPALAGDADVTGMCSPG